MHYAWTIAISSVSRQASTMKVICLAADLLSSQSESDAGPNEAPGTEAHSQAKSKWSTGTGHQEDLVVFVTQPSAGSDLVCFSNHRSQHGTAEEEQHLTQWFTVQLTESCQTVSGDEPKHSALPVLLLLNVSTWQCSVKPFMNSIPVVT